MVIRNNGIKLTEIQDRFLADNVTFANIHSVSIITISRILKKHQVSMKQLYTVPFERNSEHVKQLRNQYVQRVMEIEGRQTPHILIFMDEAGFNLAKTRRRGRNVIGKRATVIIPGQRGANITMCTVISTDGVLLHRPLIGPYNTERLLAFLHDLYGRVVLDEERDAERRNQPTFYNCMGQCGISPLLCSHRVVCGPSQNGVTFPPTLLSIPQPHRGIIFLMEVGGL
ncbi:uncharacterized protein LOC127959292 [Carassius gibelio]|uniref:uncharacterized protein LOC127959292 n=1 Tax=Carassius gibelio TaxID=101364 RepID=UPI0022788665|nr:uncharacterized protein LOC127959292 [Carassius gibelio]